MNLISILLILVLLIILWQDIKYRQIHVLLPFIIFLVTLYNYTLIKIPFLEILKNIAFLLLNFTIMTTYISIKNKQIINPFQNHIGLGDFVFFMAICPLFLLYNYILFFICSLLFSIVVFFIFQKWMTQKNIPLAGFVSIFLISLILIEHFSSTIKLTLLS